MAELGLVSISFREHSPAEIIAAVKKTPLTCIEWGSDVHAPCTDLEKVRQIVRLQQAAGIRCCSYGTYFRVGVNRPEEVLAYIEPARLLGTNIIRLWCGDRKPEHYSSEELEQIYEDCRRLAAIGQENGVIFCMECHDWTLTETKESALALMEAVSSPYFRMYWQPNQWVSEKENLAFATLLQPYAKHIHVFNWKGREKYPLSDASGIWKQYLRKFSPDRCLLLEHMHDDRLETLQQEAQTLAQIWEEMQ